MEQKQQYSIIKTKKNNRTLYGLQISDTSGKTYSYNCVAENKEDVEQLVNQMSSDYISPVHFADIISDFITKKALDKIALLNT